MRASIYALSVALALTASAALAQQSPPPGQQMHSPMMGSGMMMNPGTMGGGMMMNPGMMGGGMMPMMGMMDPTQHIEGRLAFLRTELKITEAQMPHWNAFAQAWRTNAKRMADLMGTMMSGATMGPGMTMGQGMTLPDRLERAEQHLSAHIEMLRAMKGPTMQLYTSLADDQKHMADMLLRGPMGMMGMM